MRSAERSAQPLALALACAEGDWPHADRPATDDPYAAAIVGHTCLSAAACAALREEARRTPAGADAPVLRT
ncbi:hypothetical protein [Streptomyces sp. LUP30]|uniref:hypothetical protein n=1 Tax=Streptomyces sp. LUP30 TaxID=1890285 RepID=UPI000851A5D4|nr:hypothetical protein [Streptomyces sp. LUP30]